MSTLKRLVILSITFLGVQVAQDLPTFHTGVSLVHVDTEVLGRNERPLAGVTQGDLQVRDAGQEQTIVSFSEGQEPLDLLLLFDVSGSMHRQVEKVAEVAKEGVQELRQGDRVAVMVFNSDIRIVAGFSNDLSRVGSAIHQVLDLPFRGGTFIIDSIGKASYQFPSLGNSGDQRHRAVLVITDDAGWPSLHQSSILEHLWEADILVSGLAVGLISRVPHGKFLGRDLMKAKHPGGIADLVEKTGGDTIYARDLSTSFPEMMHRIRSRYTLYYRLPEGEVGSFRTIDVQLSAQGRERFPGARVLARRGYRLQSRDHYGFATR